MGQISDIEETPGYKVKPLTADSGYAYRKIYGGLERHNIDAIIPPKKENKPQQSIPIRRFKYDGMHQIVRCPKRKILHRSTKTKYGWNYRSSSLDCRDCSLRDKCLSLKVDRRSIAISDDYEALLRARRRRHHWSKDNHNIYSRHRWRIEGAHSEAKIQHGLRRAVRRGLSNMAIQVYLTACVMNLKRLAALFFRYFRPFSAIKKSVLDRISHSWFLGAHMIQYHGSA